MPLPQKPPVDAVVKKVPGGGGLPVTPPTVSVGAPSVESSTPPVTGVGRVSGTSGRVLPPAPVSVVEGGGSRVTNFGGGSKFSSGGGVPVVPVVGLETFFERKESFSVASLSAYGRQSAQILLDRILDDECSEVLMNGSQSFLVKQGGVRVRLNNVGFDSVEEYHHVVNSLVLYNADTFGRVGVGAGSLIEGSLVFQDDAVNGGEPLLGWVHVVAPPVVGEAKVTIVKRVVKDLRIDDYVTGGSLSPEMGAFLKVVARAKVSTIFSGPTGSGKTVLLEACSYEFDENDRVVVVECVPELLLPVYDKVLLHPTPQPGGGVGDVGWFVSQAARMRADRIILGDVVGLEFGNFLGGVVAGADGSMATVRADSVEDAVKRLHGFGVGSGGLVGAGVRLIVQTGVVGGKHTVVGVVEVLDVVSSEGVPVLNTLFRYDVVSKRFVGVNGPSQSFVRFVGARGGTVDKSWFPGG